MLSFAAEHSMIHLGHICDNKMKRNAGRNQKASILQSETDELPKCVHFESDDIFVFAKGWNDLQNATKAPKIRLNELD